MTPNDESKRKIFTLLLIRNDCETIKTIINSVRHPIFSSEMIPYIALFCRSLEEYTGQQFLTSELDSQIYDIRNSIKTFSKEYRKGKKRFLRSDNSQDAEFRERLRFEFTKDWNIHYNLGVYFTKDKRIIGNTQLIADTLNLNGMSDKEKAEKAYSLSYNMSSIVGSVSSGIAESIDPPSIIINPRIPEYYYSDSNTNRSPFFNTAFPKDVNLFLLHIVSNLGFVNYVLSPLFLHENAWLLRIKYIVTHYAYLGLKHVRQHLDNAKGNSSGNLIHDIDGILTSASWAFPAKFRNCMMHYDLVSEGTFLIPESALDSGKTLYGLVEACFDGMEYADYLDSLTGLAEQMIQIVREQFSFDKITIQRL